MVTYRVVAWDDHYENNRTRQMKQMLWVPMPNSHDGDGYTELLDHKNGAAHFGAWCAILQVASKCSPRGTLMRAGNRPHDAKSLSRQTRISEQVIAEALPRLCKVHWLEEMHEGAPKAQEPDAALTPSTHPTDEEEKGREGKEENEQKEEKETPAATPRDHLIPKPLLDAGAKVGLTPAMIGRKLKEGWTPDLLLPWVLALEGKTPDSPMAYLKGCTRSGKQPPEHCISKAKEMLTEPDKSGIKADLERLLKRADTGKIAKGADSRKRCRPCGVLAVGPEDKCRECGARSWKWEGEK